MKRRLKIYFLVVVILVMAAVAVRYYFPEISAITWHVRHGSYAEMGGIRVRVPLAYEALDPGGVSRLSIIKQSGHLWREDGWITVEFHKQPSPEVMQKIEPMRPESAVEKEKLGERAVTFAGTPGNCVELIPQVNDPRLQRLMEEFGMREIDCWFGDTVEVEFLGDEGLKSDFYSMIQTAEQVKKKS